MGASISGSISNVLTIMSVQPTNSGIYSVIVTNIAGSVTSSNAVLTVASLSFVNIVSAGGGSFILSGVGGTNNGNLLRADRHESDAAVDQLDAHCDQSI